MTASAEALNDLLALQQLDSALDQVRHQRANLPERSALNVATTRQASIQAALDDVEARRAAIVATEAKLERSLRELDARTADLAGRLQRTMVVREAEALMVEQRSTQARRTEVEDEELALLEEEEALDAERAERETELADTQATVETATAALVAAEGVLAEQGDDLARRRNVAASTVPADLLARYEALRLRFDGVAVARLDGNRCTGCHLALSTAALERIRSAPPDEWVECEECGRLLVRP